MGFDEDMRALAAGLIGGDAEPDDLFDFYGFESCCEDAFIVVVEAWRQWTTGEGDAPDAARVAAAMSHDTVLEAFDDDELAGADLKHALEFAQHHVDRDAAASAGPRSLLGRVLDRTGDLDGAQRLYRQALVADDDFSPAQRWLAGIELDRGNLRSARRLLAGVFDERDPSLAEIDHHLSVQESAGRNDPCPCGSGKKFKQCHRVAVTPAAELPDLVYYKVQRHLLEDHRARYLRFVQAAGGPELLQDPFPLDVFVFEAGGAVDYMAQRGSSLPEAERELLAAMVARPRAMYEITEVAGPSLGLRNLVTGELTQVADRFGSSGLQIDQTLLGRVVEHNDLNELVGTTIDVPPAGRDELMRAMGDDYTAEQLLAWFADLTAPIDE